MNQYIIPLLSFIHDDNYVATDTPLLVNAHNPQEALDKAMAFLKSPDSQWDGYKDDIWFEDSEDIDEEGLIIGTPCLLSQLPEVN